MGLSAEMKERRLEATDALITAIAEARAPARFLGEQIVSLAKWLKLKRVGEAMAECTRVSSLHCSVVSQAIDVAIAGFEKLPKTSHYLLTPLLEALLKSGRSLSQTARDRLVTVKGSSRAAKLAKQIMAVQPDQAKQQKCRAQAATAITDRAERWQRINDSA